MTQAKLNSELYQKMFAEQEKYKDWLQTLTSDEVMKHSYEYTIREDILLFMEYNDLSRKQADALLKLEAPLAEIYQKYDSQQSRHMDDIQQAIESRANDTLRADFIASRRAER